MTKINISFETEASMHNRDDFTKEVLDTLAAVAYKMKSGYGTAGIIRVGDKVVGSWHTMED